MSSSISLTTGPTLKLRLVRPGDAQYIFSLRTDPRYNKYLSPVEGSVEDQRSWIEAYKLREAAGQEFYYIIKNDRDVSCGTVRIYHLRPIQFTWGSWILDHNKPAKAALESALLSFSIGFEALDRQIANVDVRRDNTHAEAFYRRLGMTETHRTEQDIFFAYHRERFLRDRAELADILESRTVK